ncbi:hypothetical protein QYE76_027961 [Lolium multiflorum]|uniref:Uncharacterized protein n=1 Tax=Lolium multiflorum TaxID=4521 RepID=A0AAD8QNL6_LOLMU|nr:hypothetical protein QYE76_027961 [Lolium multiflorum]
MADDMAVVCPTSGGGRGRGGLQGETLAPFSSPLGGGGGLAFGCGGAQACAVSPDYAICLVSPAATMASLGWSPAWGPDLNKGGGPRASIG